ncbi:hypothetical protein ACQ86D_22865 [Streptomyces galilaeus]
MRAKTLVMATLMAALAAGPLLSTPARADDPDPGPAASVPGPSDPVEVFQTGGDYVHFSSTPPATASAHGWWLDSDSRGAKAKVTVDLQVKDGGHWHTVATGHKTVKQGGGSARRANARFTCVGTKKTTWRSVVDVDIIGVADSPNKLETPAKTYRCGVG